MAKFIRVLFCIFIGVILGATIAGMLVALISDNVHDKSLEIANTAAFFGAPVGAILGLIAGLLWRVPAQRR
jgi:gas vesicle protein